ncbi:unnamed protein product [Rhizopus stolonifer]
MSPVNNGFISSSFDSTVRLWDLRTSNGRGFIKGKGNTIAAFNKPGTVFAVGTNSNKLMMYDYREFQKGPFSILPAVNPMGAPFKEWTNAFTGKVICRLVGNANPKNMRTCGEEASISSDGKFVMADGSDTLLGCLPFWTTMTPHSEAITVTSFSPYTDLIVTGNNELAMWLPELKK